MPLYTTLTTLLTLTLTLTPSTLGQSGPNILSFVDPLIGTVNGGHVFPGATLPFGMAKAVADVNGENQGGFASDGSNVTGFSHMHDSGTGGVSWLSFCESGLIALRMVLGRVGGWWVDWEGMGG